MDVKKKATLISLVNFACRTDCDGIQGNDIANADVFIKNSGRPPNRPLAVMVCRYFRRDICTVAAPACFFVFLDRVEPPFTHMVLSLFIFCLLVMYNRC